MSVEGAGEGEELVHEGAGEAVVTGFVRVKAVILRILEVEGLIVRQRIEP